MSKLTFEKIVDDFHKTYPRPLLNGLVVIWYDISKEWPNSWPSGNLPGVYAFLDTNENPLYIGKASSGRNLKIRLSGYFKNRQGQCIKSKKAEDTRYVGLLPLPVTHGFEAPAIEEYLITFCSERPNKYPKLRNKIIVAKSIRKANKKPSGVARRQLIAAHSEEYNKYLNKYLKAAGGNVKE